jgi:hypothetical protein
VDEIKKFIFSVSFSFFSEVKKALEAGSPGTHVSKNCYLLVYVRADRVVAEEGPRPTHWAVKYVEADEKEVERQREEFVPYKVRV